MPGPRATRWGRIRVCAEDPIKRPVESTLDKREKVFFECRKMGLSHDTLIKSGL